MELDLEEALTTTGARGPRPLTTSGNVVRKEMRMPKFTASDGALLHFELSGNGPLVAFVNPGNATNRMWDGQVASLSGQCRTLTFDWRGTGRSDGVGSGCSAHSAVRDLIELLEHVGEAPMVLVGQGIGGHLAIIAGEQRPDLISGLLIASSGPWYCGERDGIEGGMSEAFVAGTGRDTDVSYIDFLAEMTDTLLFHTPVSDIVRTATVLDQLGWPLHILQQYASSMRDIDHRPYLSNLTQPTIVLHGRHDRKQRLAGAQYLAQSIPGAELIVLEQSAHSPSAEEPKEYNRAILSLVARVRAEHV